MSPFPSVFAFFAAALASFLLIAALRRLLPTTLFAATVDHRANHVHAARQIGGLAAVPVAVAVFATTSSLAGLPARSWMPLGTGLLVLWLAGAVDDRRGLGPILKFPLQIAAAAIVVLAGDLSIPYAAFLPAPAADVGAVIVLVWFVNMANFMDGLDLITVTGAGTAMLFGGFLLLLAAGDTGGWLATVAALGALAGFALHNRPPAPVFLGDSGSLPLGLAAGYLTLRAAESVSPLIALLPFAYYLADTLTTLAKRALERKNVLSAHSEHAYQVARRAGAGTLTVVGWVAATGVVSGTSALLAAAATATSAWLAILAGWLAGFGLVVLFRWNAARRPARSIRAQQTDDDF